MKPNEIQVGKVYKHEITGILYLGVGRQKSNRDGERQSSRKIIERNLIIIKTYNESLGYKVVQFYKNPSFWDEIVLTDKEFKLDSSL